MVYTPISPEAEKAPQIVEKRRILAFGFHTGQNQRFDWNGNELFVLELTALPDVGEIDFVIVQSGSFDRHEMENDAVKTEKRLLNVLERGKTVCFLLSDLNDILTRRVLLYNKISCSSLGKVKLVTDVLAKRSEFEKFLKEYGTAGVAFQGDIGEVVCTAGKYIVGFAKNVKKGLLILLPCHVYMFSSVKEIVDLLRTLSDSLVAYSAGRLSEPPRWINMLESPGETRIKSEIEVHRRKIEELEVALSDYSKLKSMLWLEGNHLDDSVRSFFEKMGFQTRKDEGFEEDFWILENGNEQIIVEVKGKSKNLQRPDISKLDEHRGAREKPDDFPAMLVVNSFTRAASLKEKDVDISPAELKKATRTHVLIVRTLDLFNLNELIEKGKIDQKTMLNLLQNETGWLKVSTDGYEIVKE